ncbi:dihydroorotate dehydrogenase [Denitromonas ohlonensis]|jgi:dihydroorotate dehydrogenase|uniref:Dihydroorotate dehydrogenase n=2 Tax=Denitromonas TaxID=139331 RepID=A0A557RR98_9RHOO|nr:dihydroorotate dehydrogenase [Denitromonas ohlonensis]TVO76539.1 dihydroorotate dehydrogenase [Denitromonas ohlonensis]
MSRVTAPHLPWHDRPGLAGGIDTDGRQAATLLELGFGSVEFGSVAAHPRAPNSLAPLLARLAALPPRSAETSAIGIGVGLSPGAPVTALPAQWLNALHDAWSVADYLSFNLSARARRPLLAPEHHPMLAVTLRALVRERKRLPRHIALALKLPLGDRHDPLPALADTAAHAGIDCLTLVLADPPAQRSEQLARLADLAHRLAGGPALVAVGGIRNARDVDDAREAGASAVQVHRAFIHRGPACLKDLSR